MSLTVPALLTPSAGAPFERGTVERRELGEHDVLIDIAFAGICHSDIHQAREEWGKATFPMVPGHEIAGVVAEVGPGVTRYAVGDRVGVAWGRTVYHLADVMPFADLQGVTVMQLCGNLGAPYSYRPDQCTTEIARRLNAEGINIYAPLVLSSRELADALRAEPVVSEQLTTISSCQLALYSVGGIEADSHLVKCGALSAEAMHALGQAGAAGVIAGQIIDANGQWLDCDHNHRCISADLESIRAIGKRMMVVQEDSKFEPLVAAVRGGFASHLVVTTSMARRLLERWTRDGHVGNATS